MADRYFSAEPITGSQAWLVEDEARHLVRVMRANVGDDVVVFDGSGAEFLTRLRTVAKDRVELEVVQRQSIDRETSRDLTLAVALPKGDRQRWLVEKLVELGVRRLIPIRTERGVSQPVEAAIARLKRAVIEASKQCGRNRLMEIAAPLDWLTLATTADTTRRLIAHPGQDSQALQIGTDSIPTLVAIGPEGGFTDAEVAAALECGWRPIRLGATTLRVETAAIALAAALLISNRETVEQSNVHAT